MAIIALNIARETGIEQMLKRMDFSATILRANYYIDNASQCAALRR